MTLPLAPAKREGLWVEWTFALITLGSVFYSAWFLWKNSYLPAPFFYEPGDIFADWFNPAYWARDKGTYDVWLSLYPPASFVFLRIFGLDRCYVINRWPDASLGYDSRDCDWVGVAAIFAFFIIDVAMIYITFRKQDKVTALPRTIILGLSWSMLDGVERGNLVLASFLFVVLAAGPILRSSIARIGFAGLAINFKLYLVAAFVPLLLKRKWRRVESILIATVAIYLLTYCILGRGWIVEIIRNIISFSHPEQSASSLLDIWVATTYEGWLGLLKGDAFPIVLFLGSRPVAVLTFAIIAITKLVQGMIVMAAAMVWLRPESVPTSRVINLGVMLALITSESGGYTPVYYMYFVLMEPWKSWEQKIALLMCMIMSPSLDYPLQHLAPVVRDTYFRHSTTVVNFELTISPLLRPMVILILGAMVALRTIRQVLADVDKDGWATRWRFRDDASIIPWALSPRALVAQKREIVLSEPHSDPASHPIE